MSKTFVFYNLKSPFYCHFAFVFHARKQYDYGVNALFFQHKNGTKLVMFS